MIKKFFIFILLLMATSHHNLAARNSNLEIVTKNLSKVARITATIPPMYLLNKSLVMLAEKALSVQSKLPSMTTALATGAFVYASYFLAAISLIY